MSPASLINWPATERVVLHCLLNPDAHDQGRWSSSCGTVRCVAGWTVEFAGHPLILRGGQVFVEAEHGFARSVRDVAMTELGLSGSQATALFAATNTIEDIRAIVTLWADRDGYPLDERIRVDETATTAYNHRFLNRLEAGIPSAATR